MANRNCAYCGKEKCKCTYRAGRMGTFSISISNITKQTTMGEIRKFIAETYQYTPDDTPAVFSMSVTKLDMDKISKREAKETK